LEFTSTGPGDTVAKTLELEIIVLLAFDDVTVDVLVALQVYSQGPTSAKLFAIGLSQVSSLTS